VIQSEVVVGPKLWRMRNARGADAMRQAEESSGALVESQAFLGAGKCGLSGRECTRFRGAYCGNPGTSGRWSSRPTAEGLQGAGAPRGGSGVRSEPEAEAAVRDLSMSGRRSTWIDRRGRGDERSPRE
jgi:hypothetical protein